MKKRLIALIIIEAIILIIGILIILKTLKINP